MNSKFFYEVALKQFEFALNSLRINSTNIDNLIKNIFTIVTLIIGFCYFLIENKISTSIQYIGISLFFLSISLIIGFYTNQPKSIDYLNPVEIYNEYYELDMLDEQLEKNIAEITITMSEDVQNIRKLCNDKARYLFGMQLLVLIGLLFLGLSIVDLLKS